ncbi:MAG: hypothetical protein IKD45_04915 [Clostridia bacterium]|nr:hypothetical protein [Clostridia bacterium]
MKGKLVPTLEEILRRTREKIEKGRHGAVLTVKTEITFIDNVYDETPEFVQGKSTGVCASLTVYVKDREADEDPCYGYSMILDFEKKGADPEAELERERQEFETEMDRFTALLEASDDPYTVIAAESEAADREAEEALREFNAAMKKIKVYTVIAIAVAVVIVLAIGLANALIK